MFLPRFPLFTPTRAAVPETFERSGLIMAADNAVINARQSLHTMRLSSNLQMAPQSHLALLVHLLALLQEPVCPSVYLALCTAHLRVNLEFLGLLCSRGALGVRIQRGENPPSPPSQKRTSVTFI